METELIICVVSCIVTVFAIVYARSEHCKALSFTDVQLESIALSCAGDDLKTQIDETENENQRLRSIITSSEKQRHEEKVALLQELEALHSRFDAAMDEAGSKNRIIGTLTASLHASEGLCNELSTQIQSATEDNQHLELILRNLQQETEALTQERQRHLTETSLMAQQLRELENIKTDSECVSCLNSKRNYLLEPCNHLCLCEHCALNNSMCPLCRVQVVHRKRVFM